MLSTALINFLETSDQIWVTGYQNTEEKYLPQQEDIDKTGG